MKKILKVLTLAASALGCAATVQAQENPYQGRIPNFAAIGIGTAPDYLGSDDYIVGGAPLLRMSIGTGPQYLSVEGSAVKINVLDHPNFRFGPMGVVRLKRGKVDDDAVDDMKNIPMTVELGGFAAYDWVVDSDPRNRWILGTQMSHDVGGVHDGFVAVGSVQRWFGVGRAGMFGLNAGLTYGSNNYTEKYFSVTGSDARRSGLKKYDADAGFRDVRLVAMYIQPLSPHWAVGVGGMYRRLLDDAADSPVVKRGSRDQFVAGVGIGRMW